MSACRHIRTIVLPLALLLGGATASSQAAPSAAAPPAPPQAAAGAKPGKSDLAALFKRTRPKDGLHVSLVLDDLGDGRIPVLVRTKGRICGKEDEEGCEKVSSPALVLVKRAPSGWELGEFLEIPAEDSAYNDSFAWGQNTIKDWDGDGRKELLIIYKYTGHPTPGTGNGADYRELAIINLEPKLSVALHVELDAADSDADLDYAYQKTSTFQFKPGSGSAQEFVVNSQTEYTPNEALTKKKKKPEKAEKKFRYDPPTDTWVEQTAGKAPAAAKH